MKKALISLLIFITFRVDAAFAINPMVDRGFYYTGTTEPVSGVRIEDKTTTKVGQSEALDIMGLITTGDASVQKACRDGDIKKIDRIEQKSLSIYWFFEKFTTKCYGQ